MGFSEKMVNLVASPKGDSLNYRAQPNTSSAVKHTSQKGLSAGRTTGDFFDMPDGRWLAVLLNKDKTIAFVRTDVTTFTLPKTNPDIKKEEIQPIIDKLVASDNIIYHTLLRSAALIQTAESKKIDTKKHRETFSALNARLLARQDALKNSKIVSWKTGIKNGYTKLRDSFLNFVSKFPAKTSVYNMYGVGAVGATSVVLSAVVGAGLTVAAYYAFKPKYDESTTDLKISSDLEKALASLEPAKAAAVKKDLETQVDDAYNQGKTDGNFSGMFKTILPIGLGILAFLGIQKLAKQ